MQKEWKRLLLDFIKLPIKHLVKDISTKMRETNEIHEKKTLNLAKITGPSLKHQKCNNFRLQGPFLP